MGASFLFLNILAGKGINRAEEGAIVKKQGRGIVRAGYEKKKFKKQQQKNKKNF